VAVMSNKVVQENLIDWCIASSVYLMPKKNPRF